MRDGPTTSQGVTILGLGALTATAVTAVPLVLYSRQERVSLSGLTGLLGFLLLFFGGLLLTFTLPRFIAPGVPVYERSALERANPGMPLNDGSYRLSPRAEWRPFVLVGLTLWACGLALSFAI